jgi:hypothetical protein
MNIRHTAVRASLIAVGALAVASLRSCAGLSPATQSKTPLQSSSMANGSQAVAPLARRKNLQASVIPGPNTHEAAFTHEVLRLTNVGPTACTTSGFPAVSFVSGDNGTQFGAAAKRVGPAGQRIVLAPQQVDIAVTQPHYGYDPASCQQPTAVRGLRIYAPNDTGAMFVPQAGQACSNSSISQLMDTDGHPLDPSTHAGQIHLTSIQVGTLQAW